MKRVSNDVVALCAAVVVAIAGCSQNAESPKKNAARKAQSAGAPHPAMTRLSPHGDDAQSAAPHGDPSTTASPNAAAGVSWTVPSGWQAQGPRPMRAATYAIPAAPGDPEGGECGVFYFGPEQGGQVDANIARWAGQFDGAPAPVRSAKSVNGIDVVLVQISGDYLAPAGPMMESQGKKPGFRLLGAIVDAPEGAVFFKLVGPAKTIATAEADFDALIASLTRS